jgi:hypothetical protein
VYEREPIDGCGSTLPLAHIALRAAAAHGEAGGEVNGNELAALGRKSWAESREANNSAIPFEHWRDWSSNGRSPDLAQRYIAYYSVRFDRNACLR